MDNEKEFEFYEWNKEVIKTLTQKKGVYSIILEDGSYYYIGASYNLVKRVNRFFGKGWQSLVRQGIKFKVHITFCENMNEASKLEYDMIEKIKPKENTGSRYSWKQKK